MVGDTSSENNLKLANDNSSGNENLMRSNTDQRGGLSDHSGTTVDTGNSLSIFGGKAF